ncbi:MAG: phosphotransferase [bacterium]|jgi:Ser/Thr protein kinase RdoA (MazF antagonist)|nr:phosphotransferase [bacterium]
MQSEIPNEILQSYDIGKISEIKAVTDGLVHKTYAITSETGEYILQKLHPVLSTDEIAEDFAAVTIYLKEMGFPTPDLVRTGGGGILAKAEDAVWRMQTRLPGQTVHVLEERSMAKKAGEMYARFHKTMAPLEYNFKAKKLLHETEKEYERLLEAAKNAPAELLDEVEDELALLKEELPKYFLPTDLPLRVIHGDPKVSNILFDENAEAVAIIDLDTCNRRPLLVELGDAFRSWCGNEEDDPKNKFCLRMFQSAWGGYKKGADGFMTQQELEYLPQAIGTIILELSARFLADYFNDNYFGWDETRYESRRAHNLARCRGQLMEFKSYKEKFEKIVNLVSK